MNRRLVIIVPLVLLAAACAQKQDLKPVAGKALPPAPYGSDHRPSAAELLKRNSQAAPQRSVELRTRSEERQDDPFDLPPEG
ncbi:MAG: hypothetical protein J2O44_07230 [Porphyrobacter sp.]|nr:hypothetical protein [Porphyrobacter sp.]